MLDDDSGDELDGRWGLKPSMSSAPKAPSSKGVERMRVLVYTMTTMGIAVEAVVGMGLEAVAMGTTVVAGMDLMVVVEEAGEEEKVATEKE
ncbi:hypothetical protein Syun_019645 [Stephania yunnanensis]|uniref:Uncharacterized protein n=1 Tax=Stephania yunnanensis TaxID=152371 RepID=A0AAP0IW69_9MAGN